MDPKPILPPRQQAIVDRFKKDAAKICGRPGSDPDRPGKGAGTSVTFENEICSEPGCNWRVFEMGLCRQHYQQANKCKVRGCRGYPAEMGLCVDHLRERGLI